MTHDKVFRFAVGQKDGPKASVWDICWNNKKPDLYLFIRDLMGNRKISLHASGQRTYAFINDEIANTARRQSGFLSQTRRICEWKQPSKDVADGVVHELSICIPTSDLSTGLEWPDGKEIAVIPPAPASMAAEIMIFMSHQASSTARLPNCYTVGPGCLGYQYIAIENGLKNSITEFREMVSRQVQKQRTESPASFRVVSGPVPLVGDNGDGPRVIYDLSVR